MKLWYAFAKGRTHGNRNLRNTLGGKGANLAEMCNLGIPVPPGFTLPTDLCKAYYADGNKLSDAVLGAIDEGIEHIEECLAGPRFGESERPLLVSVRSGARASMPGMMDTVLNIGLTDETVEGLAAWSGSRRFALDSYRRLIQMFGDVVCGISREVLEEPMSKLKAERGVRFDNELTDTDLESVVATLKGVFEAQSGSPFPQDARLQLRQAVAAVFGSWMTRRACTYREIHSIPDAWGTAANVQAMVFGNFGASSGTGVAFSRNPSTGAKAILGEWLPNAQGEDVVAGTRTPGPLEEKDVGDDAEVGSLEKALPGAYQELLEVMARLERHYADIQDVEFTIQENTLYLLQTRNAKRTAEAALKCAVDMVDEELINKKTAVGRVTPEQVDQLMHPQLDPSADKVLLATGLPASPGAASGEIVISSDRAEELAKEGKDVILVRRETSPEDIHGMHAARGILTATGGMTSHAAVVARGMGRPCVSGCRALIIDDAAGTIVLRREEGDVQLRVGEHVTIDGASGSLFEGLVPTVQAELGGNFEKLMGWADDAGLIGIRANADTPEDAAIAVKLGAQGIGLCRTEHMFFAPDRILAMREMILADDEVTRRKALAKLQPMQQSDFEGILEAMGARPVTIRLLDPPLHEFLPQTEEEIQLLAKDMETTPEAVKEKAASLHEFNPMLGHRGCRLGLAYPEIVEMQAKAILDAACIVAGRGIEVQPEIMVPLVMEPEELERIREQVKAIAEGVYAAHGRRLDVKIGTMIELPRACVLADEIAQHADFFSFGTNDLTQTTMGVSRDDSGKYLPKYVEEGLLTHDPFASLDKKGVGKFVEMATRLGRSARKNLKVGICGEHGGDPASIEFFASTGLDYVSCSPYRLPVARLAAAHAAIFRGS